MFYLISQTRKFTCFRRNIGLKAIRSGIFCSALASSLSRKISHQTFPRTKRIERTIKRRFSEIGLESRPNIKVKNNGHIKDKTVRLSQNWTYKSSSRINVRRNVSNFRTFCTSGRMHSENKSEIIGEWRENKVLTVPNILCFGRILASPALGYLVLSDQYLAALGLFVVAGFTDMLDGLIARRFPSQMSYLGSILDPIADKILIGVLTISLSLAHLIPVPLAVIILGRDIGLILASFIVRFISLPPPRTLTRYFDFQLPTVQVTPSMIGKINTALQLSLISLSLAAPIVDITEHSGLLAIQYTVGITTIASGLDYFITQRGFSILGKD